MNYKIETILFWKEDFEKQIVNSNILVSEGLDPVRVKNTIEYAEEQIKDINLYLNTMEGRKRLLAHKISLFCNECIKTKKFPIYYENWVNKLEYLI